MVPLSPVQVLYWQKLVKLCLKICPTVGVEGSKEEAKFRVKKCKGQMLRHLLALRSIKPKNLLDLE